MKQFDILKELSGAAVSDLSTEVALAAKNEQRIAKRSHSKNLGYKGGVLSTNSEAKSSFVCLKGTHHRCFKKNCTCKCHEQGK